MAVSIFGTDAFNSMQEKTSRYDSLVSRAENLNRENNGVPTKREAEFYLKAMDVCDEIKNANLSNRGVVSKWESNKEYCKSQFDAIVRALTGKTASGAAAPAAPTASGVAPAGKKAATYTQNNAGSGAAVSTKTATGFTTKNANEYVSAETIESWYQRKPNHRLEDLVGMDALVETLISVAGNMGFTKTDALLNIDPEKGILLYGYHGNGKTYTIEAFANYLMEKNDKIKFLQLTGSMIKDKYVGVAEKRVEAAFKEAIDNAAEAPCILFFDEIDNVCKSRDNATSSESSLTNAFLEAWNALVRAQAPVIILGATNNPWLVDAPVISRFKAAKIYAPLPCEETRKTFVENKLKNICLKDDISPEEIAADTENFDFRDLGGLTGAISGKMKMLAMKYAQEQNPDFEHLTEQEKDELVSDALLNGEVCFDREAYEAVRANCHASLTAAERKNMEAFTASLG